MRRKAIGFILMLILLMSSFSLTAFAQDSSDIMATNCTSWVFHQQSTSCTDPICGPGAVLHTKYLKGYRVRYCNSTGKEQQPYTKVKPGCC